MEVWNLCNPEQKKAFCSWEKVITACSCFWCLAVSWVPVLLSVNLSPSLSPWLSPEESWCTKLLSWDIFLLPCGGDTSLTFIVEPLKVAHTLVFLPSCTPVTGVILLSALRTGAYFGVSPVETGTSAPSWQWTEAQIWGETRYRARANSSDTEHSTKEKQTTACKSRKRRMVRKSLYWQSTWDDLKICFIMLVI